jgi:hypothetical protein
VTDQLSFDEPPDGDPGISLYWQQRAAEFHLHNAQVYDLLVHYARVLHGRGHRRVGIELLWNRMRWDWLIRTERLGDEFKLNQNFKAWYARQIMEREPDLADVFETRSRA